MELENDDPLIDDGTEENLYLPNLIDQKMVLDDYSIHAQILALKSWQLRYCCCCWYYNYVASQDSLAAEAPFLARSKQALPIYISFF